MQCVWGIYAIDKGQLLFHLYCQEILIYKLYDMVCEIYVHYPERLSYLKILKMTFSSWAIK